MVPDEHGQERPDVSRSTGASSPEKAVEERYRKIFQYSNDAIMIVDFDDEDIVDVNPAACELLGYPYRELLELDPAEIHPDDFERVRERFLSEVVETGSGWTDDLLCITKGGEEKPTEISGAVLEDASGDPSSRMVAILRDISDRVDHRRELEETVTRLERFAQVLSHDLRNPLTIVEGEVALARETGDPEHFEAAQGAVDRMAELVEDLLVLTREGEAVGSQQLVELKEGCHEAWGNVAAADATLGVETTLRIEADPSRLQELLENLFRNAVEHCSDDVEVTVGGIESLGVVGFYVADDGPGIPSEDRDRVFDWGHTSEAGGTGFGLAIVERIAEGHGWEVAVTDGEAGGTRFEFTGVTAR